jgi:hypothetical protein
MEQHAFDTEQIAQNAIEVEQLKELAREQFGGFFEKTAKVFDNYMRFQEGNGIFEQYRRAFNDRSVELVSPRIQVKAYNPGMHHNYTLLFYPLTISLQDSIAALTIQDKYSDINIHKKSLGANFNVSSNLMQVGDSAPYSIFNMVSSYDSEVSAARLSSGIRLTPSRAFLHGIEGDNHLRIEYVLFSAGYLKDAEGQSVYSKYPLLVKVDNGRFRISYNLSFNADTGYCEIHKNTLWIDTVKVGDVSNILSSGGKNIIISRENKIGLNIIETKDSLGIVPSEEAKYIYNYNSPGIIIPKLIRPFDLLGGNLNGGNLLQKGDYLE